MIVETVPYTDHDGNDHIGTFHFHMSEATYLENLDLGDKMQEILDIAQAPQHIMTTEENQKMMDLLKRFMSLSYGIRLPDDGFDQDDPVGRGPIWKKFRISSAYNAFLMSLFRPEPLRAAVFMYRVMPDYLRGTEEDIDMDALSPELRKIIRAELDKDKTPVRLPPGTRIVDGVVVPPTLTAVPDQPGTDADAIDPNMDYDAILEEPAKRPISQSQHDKMKSSLKPAQFEHFMSTRYVSTD